MPARVKQYIPSLVTLETLRMEMQRRSLDGLFVNALPDIRYLTGFSGSNALVYVSNEDQWLVTDGRYELQVQDEVQGWNILITRNQSLLETLHGSGKMGTPRTVGYDENHVTVAHHRNFRAVVKPGTLKRAASILPALRSVKSGAEVYWLRKAATMADRVFSEVVKIIRPGITEREIAAKLTYRATLAGSEADPFPPIVVSGPRSALIHGSPSDRKLRKGDLVIMDFGCTISGYCSDMTRTIAIGGLSAEKRAIYETVRRVQEETCAYARAGITAMELDTFARDGITRAGYGEYFQHALGHGVGLEVHELPIISQRGKEPLRAGNAITIEPGIYVPELGGVRIEDDIILSDNGSELLTHTPKELLIV